MKKYLLHFAEKLSKLLPLNVEKSEVDPLLKKAIEDQIAWAKQNHTTLFQEQLDYITRNRELIASEKVIEDLRFQAREMEEQQAQRHFFESNPQDNFEPGD